MWECYGRVRGHRPNFGGCTRLKAEPWWVDGDLEGERVGWWGRGDEAAGRV